MYSASNVKCVVRVCTALGYIAYSCSRILPYVCTPRSIQDTCWSRNLEITGSQAPVSTVLPLGTPAPRHRHRQQHRHQHQHQHRTSTSTSTVPAPAPARVQAPVRGATTHFVGLELRNSTCLWKIGIPREEACGDASYHTQPRAARARA